jgi:outer membrane protein OmpA-like peptidoglycan-associated protein
MSLSRRALPLLLIAAPSLALAQEAPAGFDAHNLHFGVNDGDPRDPLTLRRPGRFVAGTWYTGMVWEFADELATQTISADEVLPVLDNTFAVHVGGGYAVHDRVRLDASLPLYLASIHQNETSQGMGVGAMRLGAMIGLVRPEDTSLGGGFGVGLIPWVDVPIGTPEQWVQHPGWGGGSNVAATYETEKLTVSAEVGLAFFPREVSGEFSAGDGMNAAFGVGYLVAEKTGVNLEYRMGPTLVQEEALGAGVPMELWATTRHRYDDGGHILGGIAVGLNESAGTADWRAVIGGGFGKWEDPTPPDTDGDGIHDKIDQCVAKPETVNNWADDDGCPDQLATVSLHATYGGADIPGAKVVLTTPEGDQPLKTGDQPIEFQAMPELPLKATAQAAGCLSGSAEVKTAEGATDFAIPLGYTKAAKVRFKVVDGEGNPVEAATVGFRNGPERRLCAPTEPSKTDAKGSAGAEVAVGKHEIVVRAKGYAIARAPFDTAELGAGVVEVTLQKTRVEVGAKSIKILEKVFFESGSGVILDKSFPLLDEIATTLIATPKIKKVEVQGHTDDRGRDEANQKLSQERADSVVKYLVSKGVAEDRLLAKGYGEATPVESNKSSAGRASNRRVEFKILGQGKMGKKKVEQPKEGDAKKADAKKADAKKGDAKKADAKKGDAKKADAKKGDAKKADAKK